MNSEQQKRVERVENTKVAKKTMDEWLPVVKRNREKEQLDFRQENNENDFRVGQSAAIQRKGANQIGDEVSKEMDRLGISPFSQDYRIKKLVWSKKIKSRKYRSKKKKATEGRIDDEEDEPEEALRERARERISLRHRNKGKFTERLRRYGDQGEVQKVYAELGRERKKLLKKMNLEDYADDLGSDSQEENDEKLAELLEKELEEGEDNQPEGTDIVSELRRRGREQLEREARDIINSIRGNDSDKNGRLIEDGRESFVRDTVLGEEKGFNFNPKKLSGLEALKTKNEELLNEKHESSVNEIPTEEATLGKRTKKPLVITGAPLAQSVSNKKRIAADLTENLLEGVDITNLHKRYNKGQQSFKKEDMQAFLDENELATMGFEETVAGESYLKDFNQEKEEEYEKQLPEDKKPLQGWGDWTGSGIVEKKPDPVLELLKKKQQIAQIKQRRKDGRMDGVIINENKDKAIRQFQVDSLPHPFQNKDQFDYISSQPVGREWTGLTHQDRLTKPAILTRAGEIIAPIAKSHITAKSSK